jgi:hypothetical protein
MMELSDRERIVGKALRDAYDWLSDHRSGKPEGHRVVLEVLTIVADIERRMKKQKTVNNGYNRPLLARPSWPGQVVHTLPELREAALQRRKDMKDDEKVTVDEVAITKAVNAVFFAALPSRRTCDKDWRLLTEIAKGDATEIAIGRDLGIHKSAVSKAKSRRGRAADIWSAVSHLMPPRIERGRVWRSAA